MRDKKSNEIHKLALISMIFLISYFLLWLVRMAFLYLFDMNWITINVFETSLERGNAAIIYAIISIIDLVLLILGIMGLGRLYSARNEQTTQNQSERIKAINWPIMILTILSIIYFLGSYIQFTVIIYHSRLVVYGIELSIVILLFVVFRDLSKDMIIREENYKFKFGQPITITILALIVLVEIIFIPKLIYTIQFWMHQLGSPIWDLANPMISITGLEVSNMIYLIINGFIGLLSIIQVVYHLKKNQLFRKTICQKQEQVN